MAMCYLVLPFPVLARAIGKVRGILSLHRVAVSGQSVIKLGRWIQSSRPRLPAVSQHDETTRCALRGRKGWRASPRATQRLSCCRLKWRLVVALLPLYVCLRICVIKVTT
jgi:hypothetical protein